MLSNQHFYFKLIRKYIIIFGNMFNNITLMRTAADSRTELQRIKVPIVYGPKDKMVTRLESDPDLQRGVGLVLPRMSFELKNYSYDPSRKQNSTLRISKHDTSVRVSSQYMPVPYNFTFELNIYAKNIDDCNQIIEQILPYFTPDFTVTVTPIPELDFLKDTPIILDGIHQEVQYEGEQEQVRYVYATLEFTLQGYFYGPVSTPKIIRKVIANIFNDPSLIRGSVVKMNLTNGNNGSFREKDIVYKGDRLETTSAFGYVNDWNPDLGRLTLSGVQGRFDINDTIRSASANSVYTLESFDITPIKLAEIVIEPDPIDADPDDDFGYTTTVTEWPETANIANSS